MKHWPIIGAALLIVIAVITYRAGSRQAPEVTNAEHSNRAVQLNPSGQPSNSKTLPTANSVANVSAADFGSRSLGNAPAKAATQQQASAKVTCSAAKLKANESEEVAVVEADGAEVSLSSKPEKRACYETRDQVRRSKWMLDVTPSKVVSYGPGWTPHGYGTSVYEIALDRLCEGEQALDTNLPVSAELLFFTVEATTRVLVGPDWISDGSIQSPLSKEQYTEIITKLTGRRKQEVGPGGNMSRQKFEQLLEARYFNYIVAEQEEYQRQAKELHRAQFGATGDCNF